MPRFQGPAPDIGAHEYDLMAPETTISKQPKPKTQSTKATLKFSSSEPDSSFRCKVDKKPYKDCLSPLKLKELDTGKHKVLVKAIDPAANEDPTAERGALEGAALERDVAVLALRLLDALGLKRP